MTFLPVTVSAHHAFSVDNGKTFTVSPRQTYSYDVRYDDGTTTLYARVERPQLYFDDYNATSGAVGSPIVLYNGVCDATTHGSLNIVRDTLRCWNLQQLGVGPVMTSTLARLLTKK